MNKRVFLYIIVFFISLKSIGQTKLYKTHEDFLNDNFEKFDDEYIGWRLNPFGGMVKFKTLQGNIVKYNTKKFWGFTFKGHFFRSIGVELAMLQDTGKINYFFNGYIALDNILTGHKFFDASTGETHCFLSVDGIDAKIYRMAVNPLLPRDYPSFKKDFPAFQSLYDCIIIKDKNYDQNYTTIRNCVNSFNNKTRN